jgi:hypothetical protein
MTQAVARNAAQHEKIRIGGLTTVRAVRCTRQYVQTAIRKPRFPSNPVETGLFIAAIASAKYKTANKIL